MIVPMKYISLVCRADDRQATVEALADLGIVHIREAQAPESSELAEAQRERDRIERAIVLLSSRRPEPAGAAATTATSESAAAIVEATLTAAADQAHAEERLSHWLRAEQLLQPWGSFTPATIAALQQQGYQVVLASVNAEQLPELPSEAVLQIVSRQDKTAHIAVIAPAHLQLELVPAPLPETTDSATIQREIANCRASLAAQQQRLDDMAAALPQVKELQQDLDQRIRFLQARDSMGTSAALSYLLGYVPADRIADLHNAAATNAWALLIDEPEATDANVPTLVALPRWVRPIQVVFKAIGVIPGYRELDISLWFMLFFSLFFAMLIGDAGYGALFLIVTIAARAKWRNTSAQPFYLMGVLSVATIIWGALTGVYFGIEGMPALIEPLNVNNPESPNNVIRICFILGAIHLSIAHIWNAIVCGRSVKTCSELAWTMILWGNFLLASNLVVGDRLPAWTPYLYALGFVGVVLFSEPNRNVFKAIGMGVGALLLGIINSFVDVVSYVRLFAVGTAALAVEQSFNQMAASVELPGPLTVLVAALILIFGHSLNIILSAMGVLVHGVRLNVLEFSGHLGMQWTGINYRPLRRRNTDTDS